MKKFILIAAVAVFAAAGPVVEAKNILGGLGGGGIDPKIANPKLVNPNPKLIDPKIVNPKIIDPKFATIVNPKIVDPKIVNPKIIDPKFATIVNPKIVDPKLVDPKIVNPKIIDPKLATIVNPKIIDPKFTKVIDPKLITIVNPKIIDPKFIKIVDPKITKIVDPKLTMVVDPKVVDPKVVDPKMTKVINPKMTKIVNPKFFPGTLGGYPPIIFPVLGFNPPVYVPGGPVIVAEPPVTVVESPAVVRMQDERMLYVKNDTNESVVFYVLYHTRAGEERWAWLPDRPEQSRKVYSFELNPGQALLLTDDNNSPLSANKIRLWAASATRTWNGYQDADLWTVPEVDSDGNHRYASLEMQTYNFVLRGE
jgi:hypothetical protein